MRHGLARVSEPSGDRGHGHAHFYEHGRMTMSKVMDVDALESGRLGATGHFVVEEVLGYGREDPCVWLGLRMRPQILFELLC